MRHPRAYGLAGLAGLTIAAIAWAQTPAPAAAPANAATAAAPTAPAPTAPAASATPAAPASAGPATAAAAPVGTDPNALEALAATHWGDAKAGAAKAGACAACHGLDGNSTANPALYPRIAGMGEQYIARQLALFKSGHRTSGNAALMIPFAQALSAQDMRDVGAHFATQRSGAGVADSAILAAASGAWKGKPLYQVGEQLYRQGDASRGIVGCVACHGPTGAGNPGPPYPHIGGQQSWYAERRLTEYRAGTPPVPDDKLFALMAAETKSLSDEEIKGLSLYLQGLHSRTDEASPAEIAALRLKGVPAAAPAAAPAPSTAPDAAPASAASTQAALAATR